MTGESAEGASQGIDLYSIRKPLGVVAGITPFNFPAMIPIWQFAPATACGNAFILKPSERDPGVPMKLAELMLEAVDLGRFGRAQRGERRGRCGSSGTMTGMAGVAGLLGGERDLRPVERDPASAGEIADRRQELPTRGGCFVHK